MSELAVAHVSQELGVSPRRVIALIHAGRLPARRMGHMWLVPREEARRAPAGRPVGSQNAWALLALMSGEQPDWLSASVASRLKRYLRQPVRVIDLLAHSEPRSRVHRWRVLPGDLPKVAEGYGVVRTGIIEEAGLDLVSRHGLLDLYAGEPAVNRLRRVLRPIEDAADPNLILRVPSNEWILPKPSAAPAAVAAADLLSDHDPRIVRAARLRLEELLRG